MDILIIALITFFLGIIYILYTHGMGQKISFEQEEMEPMAVAYRLAVGDYSKSAQTMNTVYADLNEQGVTEVTEFGIYFDNPTDTPREKLRSLVGCILKNDTDFNKVEGIKHAVLPASMNPVATFPYKGKFSVAIGAMKVYTALAKYRKANTLPEAPVMEIYDLDNETIIYVVLTGIKKEFLEDLVKVS